MAEATKTTPAKAVVVKHENLAAALAAFQAQIPEVTKGNTAKVQTRNGSDYSYQYADLADITKVAMPLLGAHGLAFIASPTLIGEAFVLSYSLAHECGESIDGLYPLPDPLTMKPQELGSAITYARRYSFISVVGIAPAGEDDDAQSANNAPAASKTPRQAPAKMAAAPVNWLDQIAATKDMDQLRQLHSRAGNQKWLTPEVLEVFEQRRAELTDGQLPNPAEPTESDPQEPTTEWPTATPGGEQ